MAAGQAVPQPHQKRVPLLRIDLREDACIANGCDDVPITLTSPLTSLTQIAEDDGAEGESSLSVI